MKGINPTKLAPAIVLAFLALAVTSAPAENIIRQTLLGSGAQYDLITGNDEGQGTSHFPMANGGASYELFAFGSAWDENLYFLDRKIAGHYMPQASVVIHTEDWAHEWFYPEQPPRTRADQPFTLAIEVSGLLEPGDEAYADAPDASKQVLFTRTGENYNDNYVPNGDGEYTLGSYFMGNQDPDYNPVYTSLTPMAPTKAMGMERFTITSLTDETVTESAILAEEMLLVWPISEANLQGITDGATIRDSLPKITVDYKDLYPLSLTYLHIYAGPENLGTVGQIFGSSFRWHNTIVPQNEIISIENWEDLIPNDGEYTIEVLSVTPFDNWQPERLAHLSFNVNRKVKVNGQVTTSEK